MLVKSSKLSDFVIKKIIWCFCIDIDATRTSLIVRVNRNTVNRFFKLFRTVIWYHQLKEFKRVIQGEAEMDEAYFGSKRRRGVPGKEEEAVLNSQSLGYLRETEEYIPRLSQTAREELFFLSLQVV